MRIECEIGRRTFGIYLLGLRRWDIDLAGRAMVVERRSLSKWRDWTYEREPTSLTLYMGWVEIMFGWPCRSTTQVQ